MSSILKNYAGTLALLAGVVIGGVCGAVFGPAASVVKPVGDIFLNLIFTLITPLVFFSISSSICRLRGTGSVLRVMGISMAVFLVMSLVAAFLGWLGCMVFNPFGDLDTASLLDSLPAVLENGQRNLGDGITAALSVPDFPLLFSKSNLLPLIIFSSLVGAGTYLAGEKGRAFQNFLESGSEVTMKVMGLLMYLAPVGLGCYFADTVASLGSGIMGGYLRVFLLYCALTLVVFFLVNPLYILSTAGKTALKSYWRHIIPPSMTAIATASSAAAMPGSIEAAKRIGVSPAIADSVIPLGVNLHKDGSVMGGAIKVVFLMMLFSLDVASPSVMLTAIGVAILSAIVMGAIPSGGLTGEVLTCTLLGLDPKAAGIIIVIATIIDIPATLLNSTSNVVSAIVIDRFAGQKP